VSENVTKTDRFAVFKKMSLKQTDSLPSFHIQKKLTQSGFYRTPAESVVCVMDFIMTR
jgi:hypothetical protein